jgi:large subunit ribosomal protein L29
MPLLRVKEIRDMPSEERTKRLGELRTELLRLKTMVRAGGTVENPARIRELRRTIARVLTIEHEEKLGLVKKKQKEKPKEKKKEEKGKKEKKKK